MTNAFLVFDNFAPDAAEVRETVKAGELKDFIGPHGEKYTNTSDFAVPHWHTLLEKAVGFPIQFLFGGFRMDLAKEFPFNFAHADVACGDYAALVYLNPPEQCKGGTAFFKHLASGRNRLPDEMTEEERLAIEADWYKMDAWMPESMVGMKFNRLLVYPTAMYHSRFPHEGFGTGREDGRLIWVAFFNKANE